MLFLGAFFSDLYLFKDIVMFSSCFKFSKHLMSSFVDKVTIGK